MVAQYLLPLHQEREASIYLNPARNPRRYISRVEKYLGADLVQFKQGQDRWLRPCLPLVFSSLLPRLQDLPIQAPASVITEHDSLTPEFHRQPHIFRTLDPFQTTGKFDTFLIHAKSSHTSLFSTYCAINLPSPPDLPFVPTLERCYRRLEFGIGVTRLSQVTM